MAKKRKTLPKDFQDLIEKKDMEALIKVFDRCDINAYHGYNKEPALSVFGIPDELTRWLVENGADINFKDSTYGRTPLYIHCGRISGDVKVLLELGADHSIRDKYGNTPLHSAARSANLRCVKQLISYGADIDAVGDRGLTPLEAALKHGRNFVNLAEIADVFIGRGQKITSQMQQDVTRMGEDFEFHRQGFEHSHLIAIDAAMKRLYQLFEVQPVAKRQMHDGISPIVFSGKDWKEDYSYLWDYLVPGNGSAQTVQGEVVRISGKIRDEIFRNGGGNWGDFYRNLLDDFLIGIQQGNPLPEELFQEVTAIVKTVKRSGEGDQNLNRLCELSVLWVRQNPTPLPFSPNN